MTMIAVDDGSCALQCHRREMVARDGGPRGQREGVPGEEAGRGVLGDRAGADGPQQASGSVRVPGPDGAGSGAGEGGHPSGHHPHPGRVRGDPAAGRGEVAQRPCQWCHSRLGVHAPTTQLALLLALIIDFDVLNIHIHVSTPPAIKAVGSSPNFFSNDSTYMAWLYYFC